MAADEGSLYTTPPSSTLSPEAVIRVTWRLTDIDYPICLDYFQLEYYDTLYNETGFERTFKRFVPQESKAKYHVGRCVVEIVWLNTLEPA